MPKRPPKPEGVAASPRVRSKGKASNQQTIITTHVGEGRLSHGVPDWVKIAIADALSSFNKMEVALETFIWDIVGLDSEDGKVFTRIDASEKIDAAKTLSERYGVLAPPQPPNKVTMWKAMRDLCEIRNIIAHGLWGMLDLQTPVCTALRLKTEPGRVITEPFKRDRFDGFISQCTKVQYFLDEMGVRARALQPKSRRRLRKPTSSVSKHPEQGRN